MPLSRHCAHLVRKCSGIPLATLTGTFHNRLHSGVGKKTPRRTIILPGMGTNVTMLLK